MQHTLLYSQRRQQNIYNFREKRQLKSPEQHRFRSNSLETLVDNNLYIMSGSSRTSWVTRFREPGVKAHLAWQCPHPHRKQSFGISQKEEQSRSRDGSRVSHRPLIAGKSIGMRQVWGQDRETSWKVRINKIHNKNNYGTALAGTKVGPTHKCDSQEMIGEWQRLARLLLVEISHDYLMPLSQLWHHTCISALTTFILEPVVNLWLICELLSIGWV